MQRVATAISISHNTTKLIQTFSYQSTETSTEGKGGKKEKEGSSEMHRGRESASERETMQQTGRRTEGGRETVTTRGAED